MKKFLYDNYLAVINNSLGTNIFKNFYAEIDGKREDVMKDGELSCAFFVSSILSLFKLIKEPHATVKSNVNDLIQSGWKETTEPRPGDILVWEEVTFDDGTRNEHIRFYVGGHKAISNSYKLGYPVAHHWTFEGARKVKTIYHTGLLTK